MSSLVVAMNRMQLGLVTTVIIVLWVGIFAHVAQERDAVMTDTTRQGSDLAYAAGQSIDGMVAGIDQMLLLLRAAYAGDPQGFDLESWTERARLTGNVQVQIVNKNGIPRSSSHAADRPWIDVSGGDDFRVHQNNPTDTLLISEPFKRGVDGAWAVVFSRKITAADGSFDGVIEAAVDPSWLTRMYSTLHIGQGALMVTGTDGIVRARTSSSGLGMGQNIGSSDLIVLARGSEHGTFRSASPLDGMDRIVSFWRVEHYPLIVSVGVNAAGVYAPYLRDRLYCLAAGAVPTIVIMLLGTLVFLKNRRLLRSRQVLNDAVENISQGLMLIDENRRLPLINRQAIKLLGLSSEILATRPSFDELVAWQLKQEEFGRGTKDEKRFAALVKIPRFDLHDACYERTRPDGTVLEVRTQVLASGTAVRTFTDITERKRAEDRIRHMAHHDALTGLANRTLLTDRLSQALNHAERHGGTLAVLALDLDHFKAVNDDLGHAAGDKLLRQVADRLRGASRSADTLARVGGDEFVVAQTEVGQPMAAAELGWRLTEELSKPFDLDGRVTQIGSSIGIAVYPQDGDTVEALLRNADTALYRAKADGRGAIRFFEARMNLQLRERRELARDLELAIGTEQLHLHFQPFFASDTRALTGFEALLRWRHPTRGDIAPAAFIPIAEESGMIQTIGSWVLEEACRAAAAWPEPKRLSVNISAVQLRVGTLPAQIADILGRSGLAACLLELEVTETMLIDDPKQAMAMLRELRDMGVSIACDDFGTGYSSFSYLQNLAFDRIKIDKSFVAELEESPNALRIVKALVAMAESLEMDVTAEGVETERQLSLLRDLRCGEIQGFLLGHPMSGDDVWRTFRRAPASRPSDSVIRRAEMTWMGEGQPVHGPA